MVTVIFLFGFITSQAISAVQWSTTVSSVGTLKAIGVGVYWDLSLTRKTTSIDWGILEPAAQKSLTMYVRNEGNSAVTLSKSISNWNPSTISNYLTLTWDYSGQTISPRTSVQVTLTLTVSASITDVSSFSFDTTIVGSG